MLDKIFQHRILTHILYWIGILIAYPIYAKGFNMPLYESFVLKLCFLPCQILVTYFLIYFQILRLIYKKRYGLFLLSSLLGLWIFPALAHLTDDYLVSVLLDQHLDEQHTIIEIITDPFLAYYQITAFLIPFVTAAIKIVKQSFDEKQTLEMLEQEKEYAELQFLKAQIQPHFLFKTLDYLHSLSLRKSDLAPEVVVKLSEMLDYMLYQGQNQRVPLSKEVELIQHYMDLQALQYENKLTYQFLPELHPINPDISPLLLLSMLESALKYRLETQKEAIYVGLQLKTDAAHIHFQISINEAVEETGNWDGFLWQLSSGYPDKHTFDISKNGSITYFDLFLYL